MQFPKGEPDRKSCLIIVPSRCPLVAGLGLALEPFAQALQSESGVYGSQAVFFCLHASHLCGLLKSCCPGPVGFAGRVFNHLHWKPARFCWPPVLDPSFPVSLNVPGMPNADIYVLAVLCMHFFFFFLKSKNKLACLSGSELILSSVSCLDRGARWCRASCRANESGLAENLHLLLSRFLHLETNLLLHQFASLSFISTRWFLGRIKKWHLPE